MITKISNYYLKQPIGEIDDLVEFSDEEYTNFTMVGVLRTLRDEKFYNAPDIEFLGATWNLVIGTTDNIIYKLSAQNFINDKTLSNEIFNKTLKELEKVMGKSTEHPFLSKKYIWDDKEGNVLLNQVSKMGYMGVNFILTSSIIREQVTREVMT